jgi:glycosyltransferase involved in cell wall biosynthesis
MLTFVPTAGWYGWRLTTRVQFDVINAQFAVPSGLPAALVARLRSIPFVLSFIGGDLYDPSKGVSPHRHPILRWLIRRIAAQATVATAISEDTKRRARELHSVTLPIEVTHIGLVPRKFGTASRAQLKLPEAAQLAVTVGRLIPRKGYRELLAAWADVPEAHLAIIGDGPLRDELTSLAESLGITDRVRLLGYQSEEIKAQVLRAADYYVSAAQHEGFGIVFLEAMAAGLPIVATNNGGHTDFLTTQRNALLVPPGNKEELVKALARLTADTNLQTSMAAANKEDVREFYVDKTSARFMNVLRGAIERG